LTATSWLARWTPLEHVIDAWLNNVSRFERLIPEQAAFKQDVNPVLLVEARHIVSTLREIASDPLLGEWARATLHRVDSAIGWRANGHLLWSDVQTIAFAVITASGALRQEAAMSEGPRRSRVERAFEHLNRSLMIDDDLRRRWIDGFADREEGCERLGAVHLLLHGVFGFKANATGGRTDLVLGGELELTPAVLGSEVLVLTEWKLVRREAERESIARDARTQAELYARGVLAGVELRSTRFIVLVSIDHGAPIPNVEHNGVLYRHINIVIASASPSAAASGRRAASRKTRKLAKTSQPKRASRRHPIRAANRKSQRQRRRS
jgi:hypothetical protein